jgi:hypothetical protein
MTIPIFTTSAGEHTGNVARFASVIGDGSKTNINVWLDAQTTFNPLQYNDFFHALFSLCKIMGCAPFPVLSLSSPEGDPTSIEDSVFIWQDDEEEVMLLSLTAHVIVVHSHVTQAQFERLAGFAMYHGIPFIAGEAMNAAPQDAFTNGHGHEAPAPKRDKAKVFRLLDGKPTDSAD